MSDSLWSRGLQPTRLLCPRDFPGNNIGLGCHFLLQGIFPTQVLNPFLLYWQAVSLLLSHLGSPKNTGVCSHSLLQQIFLTQESNPGLPHWRHILPSETPGKSMLITTLMQTYISLSLDFSCLVVPHFLCQREFKDSYRYDLKGYYFYILYSES